MSKVTKGYLTNHVKNPTAEQKAAWDKELSFSEISR
jgi:hypothetical protein